MNTKTMNYDEAAILKLRSDYDPKADEETRKNQLKNLAVALSKSEQSIRMKLGNMGLYVKMAQKEKVKKEKQATREQLLESLATTLDVPAADLEGLERANRASLVTLNRVITELVG